MDHDQEFDCEIVNIHNRLGRIMMVQDDLDSSSAEVAMCRIAVMVHIINVTKTSVGDFTEWRTAEMSMMHFLPEAERLLTTHRKTITETLRELAMSEEGFPIIYVGFIAEYFMPPEEAQAYIAATKDHLRTVATFSRYGDDVPDLVYEPTASECLIDARFTPGWITYNEVDDMKELWPSIISPLMAAYKQLLCEYETRDSIAVAAAYNRCTIY